MKKQGFLYKTLFIIVNTIIFLNLITYVGTVELIHFPSYFIDLLLFCIFLFIYVKKKMRIPWDNKIFIWLIYYIFINTVAFIASPAGDLEFTYFKIVIFFIFFIIYMVLFFNLDNEELILTKKIMIFLGILASISLIADYIDPGMFFKYFIVSLNYYETGRSASLYLNANIAGGAMVIFLIFTIDVIPKRWRILYITILFIGLFATMSRSNIMIFMLILVIMFFQKKLFIKQLSFLFIGMLVLFLWLSNGGLEYLGEKLEFPVTENMISRVNFFANSKKTDTSDMNEREEVLEAALDMFENSPFLGEGFASTRLWHYPVAPHNTYAMHWAEFGFFGVLILPLLFFLVSIDIYRYGTKKQKQMALLVILFFAFSAIFSHNMLDQQLDVAVLIALSVMGQKSRSKSLLRKNND